LQEFFMKDGDTWLLYIDGEFVPALGGGTLPVDDPATTEVVGHAALAGREDVDRAVAAARRAVATRAVYEMKPNERARMLQRVAAAIRAHAQEAALLMTRENGKSISFSRDEVECTAQYFDFYAGAADKMYGRSIPLGKGYADFTELVPYGVSAQIVPWNFPLEIAARSVAPALAAGNAVVVKSPEVSPLSLGWLAVACAEAGVPKGYFNLLCGLGPDAGDYLVGHEGVDHIVFTGSVATGRRVLRRAADKVVPVVVELGGKSAGILFADADLDQAVHSAAVGIFANAGQVCSAGSRLLVEASIQQEVVERLIEWTRGRTMGPGIEDHWFTPLVCAQHRDRVDANCKAATAAGVHAALGGGRCEDRRGYFINPTIFVGDPADAVIHTAEVFGPVLSVLPFETAEQAISIANSSEYGLAAGVYTRDLSRALSTAQRLEAGSVYVNQWFAGGNDTPFGGFKRSGYGREKSIEALAGYVQVRNIAIRL
jgi:aldehyde dehydrogenase (NAD+)